MAFKVPRSVVLSRSKSTKIVRSRPGSAPDPAGELMMLAPQKFRAPSRLRRGTPSSDPVAPSGSTATQFSRLQRSTSADSSHTSNLATGYTCGRPCLSQDLTICCWRWGVGWAKSRYKDPSAVVNKIAAPFAVTYVGLMTMIFNK